MLVWILTLTGYFYSKKKTFNGLLKVIDIQNNIQGVPEKTTFKDF